MTNQETYDRLHRQLAREVKDACQKLAGISDAFGVDVVRVLELRAAIVEMSNELEIQFSEFAYITANIAIVMTLENLLKNLERLEPDSDA